MPVDTLLPKDKKQDGAPKPTVKELKARAAALQPVVPPKGYSLIDPDAVLKAGMPQGHLESYTPSFMHQMRDTLANSAVGRSLQQEMPKVAAALNLTPSETIQSPTYQAHGEQLLAPEYLAPTVASLSPVPLTQAGKERVEGALGAVGGLTSGKSMATMAGTAVAAGATAGIVNPASAQVLSRLVSGGFTLDMLHGLYQQHKEYRKAVDSGNEAEAHKIQGEMGVTGIMALLTGKHALTAHPFTPVTEAPTRERTNVLHRNTAGEVRQAPGQAPSVWLSPKSWESFMGSLYPGEDAAATHGVNLPANEHLHAFANDAQLSAADPHFGEVQQLLAKAHENASGGGVAIAKQRPSIQSNVNVMREELNHTWQRSLANGNVAGHLKPEAFTDLHKSIPKGMQEHLLDQGYDGESHPEMVTESAAKLMDGRPERFGVSPDEAVDFLDKYFKHVSDQHGTKALEELQHVRGIAADAKARAIGEHSGSGGGQDNSAVSGVAGGGQGGVEASVPAAGDPAFNRDKEKPTWYLKSEQLIGDKMKGPQPGEDVHKMLISGGVKPEEMQWTGLDDFLKSKGKDKVTPEEIREHLANNNIQIKEVTKGGTKPVEWKSYPNGVLYTPEGYKIERIPGNGMYRLSDPSGMTSAYDTADEAKAQVDKYRSNTREDTVPTQYGQYQLPGGENYREMLLTMPERPTPRITELEGRVKELQRAHGEALISALTSSDKAESDSLYKVEQEAERQLRNAKVQLQMAYKDNTPNTFKSSHWDEPNILAHIRFNDRTGPSGEKLLHIEEAQSDLHQLGRKKGYQSKDIADKAQEEYETAKSEMDKAHKEARKHDEEWSAPGKSVSERTEARLKYTEANEKASALREKMYEAQDKLDAAKKGVPDLPWKKNWHEQALRRMLKYASENGYEGLSWTPGVDQNSRYSLSTVADKLKYDEAKNQLTVYKDGSVVKKMPAKPDDLPGIVGKEVAQRLMDQAGEPTHHEADPKHLFVESDFGGRHYVTNRETGKTLGEFKYLDNAHDAARSGKVPNADAGVRHLEGEGLEVGGSGMKGFYDKIVPDYLNKFGKKFGAKVDKTKISVKDAYDNVDWKPEEARVLHRGDQYQVWAPNKNGYDQFQKDFSTQEEADNYIKQHAEGMGQTKSVQYLPITPEMRQSVGQEGVPLFNRERRVDSETRKRVEDMTPEEMRKALLTSDVTGAPNRRAFDDAENASPAAAIGMSDADGLKALNDKFGYAAGNELLKAKAEALKAAGLDAYHEKGDEFLYRGASPQDLKEKLDKARQILRDRIIEVTLKDGTKLHFKGADFSYGTGKDLDESENGLKEHKEAREKTGERARGELRGITQVGAADGGERPGTPK
jgi:GGDEF domain-containing protein